MTPASAPLATAKGANAKSARMREVNEDMTHDPRKETYRPPMTQQIGKWQLSLRLGASSQGIKAPLTKGFPRRRVLPYQPVATADEIRLGRYLGHVSFLERSPLRRLKTSWPSLSRMLNPIVRGGIAIFAATTIAADASEA
jgi:hypothetical protein